MSADTITKAKPLVVLKVLSGPCKGKKFKLAPGEYSLGSEEAADIFVDDSSIAANHARVFVNNGGILIEPVDQPLRMDEKFITSGATAVMPRQFFSAGTTQLRFFGRLTEPAEAGPDETMPQEGLDKLDEPFSFPDKAVEEEPMNIAGGMAASPGFYEHTLRVLGMLDQKIHAASRDNHWLASARVIYEKTTAVWDQVGAPYFKTFNEYIAPQLQRFVPGWAELSRRQGFGVGAAVVTIVMAVGFTQVRATSQYTSSEQALRYVISDLKLGDVQVEFDSDSRAILRGYVDTGADKQQLIDSLRANEISSTELRVQTGERLAESVSDVLRELGLDNLRSEYLGGGSIAIDGFVSSEHEWQEASEIIRRDFPTLHEIEDEDVVTLDVRVEELRSRLLEQGLDNKLDVQPDEYGILVTGTLISKEMGAWRREAREFRRKYNGLPKLINKVTVLKPGDRPDVNITGTVVSSNNRFFMTTGGVVYHEGDQLPDGSIVKAITARQIVFTRNSHDFVHVLPYRS